MKISSIEIDRNRLIDKWTYRFIKMDIYPNIYTLVERDKNGDG